MKLREERYDWAGTLLPRGKTTHLVLHHQAAAGTTAQDIHRYHRSLGWSGIGYHYYIRQDGAVYRGRPEEAVGGHTKGFNDCSIGICFEGDFERETMKAVQKAAGMALVAELKRRYPGIRVCGHRELAATACPGKQFPLEEMKEAENLDNTPDNYAAAALAWAEERGIIKGDETGNLKLKEAVTRQDLLVFLYRAMEGKG